MALCAALPGEASLFREIASWLRELAELNLVLADGAR